MKITRIDLYKKTWETPMTQLAKELDLAYHLLKKTCKEHEIPIPPVGHWQRIRFGKKITKPILTGNPDLVITIDKPIPYISPLKIKEKEIQLFFQGFQYPSRLSNPHPLVRELQEHLKSQKPDEWFDKPGMIYSGRNKLDVNTTMACQKRALLFIDTFIDLFQRRGHSVSIKNSETVVTIQEISMKIAVRETFKVVKPADEFRRDREMAATGTLCLKMDEIWGKEWYDGSRSLEKQLFNIMAYFEIYAKTRREEKIRWEEERRVREIEQQKEEDILRIKNEERTKFNQIFVKVERWKKAQIIRDFISQTGDFLPPDERRWLSNKADWIDPVINRRDEVLGAYDEANADGEGL